MMWGDYENDLMIAPYKIMHIKGLMFPCWRMNTSETAHAVRLQIPGELSGTRKMPLYKSNGYHCVLARWGCYVCPVTASGSQGECFLLFSVHRLKCRARCFALGFMQILGYWVYPMNKQITQDVPVDLESLGSDWLIFGAPLATSDWSSLKRIKLFFR